MMDDTPHLSHLRRPLPQGEQGSFGAFLTGRGVGAIMGEMFQKGERKMKESVLKRTKGRIVWASVLVVALLAFIWGNSAMPGQTSSQMSGWVGQLLRTLLPFLPLDTPEGMHVLRKLAHFSEFAALGFSFGWLFGMLCGGKAWFLLPVACGVAAACVDETIQVFSPGRHCSIVDVGIDSGGVVTRLLVLVLGPLLFRSNIRIFRRES